MDDPIVFETGIPMPARPTRSAHRNFRLGEMPLGASLLRPHRDHMAINMAVRRAQSKYGYRYATRSLEEGIRVWRVA